MSLVENYQKIKNSLPEEVVLVAVSKTKPVEDIQALYDAGVRDFGENKIQEMCEKYESLPKDIRWHMIGALQSNKVKYMAEFVHLIHGVHKKSLLKEIDKRSAQAGRVQEVLLEVKIAEEDSKHGMTRQSAREILETQADFPNVKIAGLMGMATFTDDESQVTEEFKELHQIFVDLQKDFPQLQVLSMGMSVDYLIAVEQGSTMVRVGSKIFGERNYH
ncbi:YggS family pyridoxal phosphate-dependent enzyme [Ornithobacterium rhinotracheale]|uniref:YggS family pyridoxal phosphate-dependent enzyme n=1 Tax=Ornithobacterium rhinotracheale TaxID=28251 RepID=UPI00129C7F64|nr:YggS family pyridoxal phosphate-dependent enzyme [Ornithobacterium rhinotracheale]MRJ10153.1 YggS family pyridoxal phosphate-dependent enzyme [Ornithobacterium rhinotracheale]